MAIQPIDLQTLFARINQVGKEVAEQRGSAEATQAVEGRELVQETDQKNHSVNETKQLDEGPANVREDEEQHGSGGGRGNRKRESTQEDESDPEVFSDPDLGKNVDISG
jgi:hypothetical protein